MVHITRKLNHKITGTLNSFHCGSSTEGFVKTSPIPCENLISSPPILVDSSNREDFAYNLFQWLQEELGRKSQCYFDSYTSLNEDLYCTSQVISHMTSPFLNSSRKLFKVRKWLMLFRNTISEELNGKHCTNCLGTDKGSIRILLQNRLLNIFNFQLKEQYDFLLQLKDSLLKFDMSIKGYFHLLEMFLSQASCALEGEKYIHSDILKMVDTRKRASEKLVQNVYLKLIAILDECYPSVEDYRCPICLSCLFRPITLVSCLHKFCQHCLLQYEARSEQYDPISEERRAKSACPLCRAEYSLKNPSEYALDSSLQNFLCIYFPNEWEESAEEKRLHGKLAYIKSRLLRNRKPLGRCFSSFVRRI